MAPLKLRKSEQKVEKGDCKMKRGNSEEEVAEK